MAAKEAIFPAHYRCTILPELDQDDILGSLAGDQIEGAIWCKLGRDEATLQLIHDFPIPIFEVSVVGFGSTPYCETPTLRLTSVRQTIREMAQFAAETLLELIQGRPAVQSSIVMACEFDVRDSTAGPRVGN